MTLMKLELNFSDLCQLALVVIALIELFLVSLSQTDD